MAIWFKPADVADLREFGRNSMVSALAIEFTEVGEDFVKASMAVGPATMQPFGRLHGGASVALAETVASLAGYLTVDPAEFAVVGLEINANHIRGVRHGHVHAVATPEALGRSTQVWTVRITDDEGRLVCLSRTTLAVIRVERM